MQILVSMSNQFDISLDTLLKENSKMVQSMDKERAMGIKNQRVTKKVFQYIEQLKNIIQKLSKVEGVIAVERSGK